MSKFVAVLFVAVTFLVGCDMSEQEPIAESRVIVPTFFTHKVCAANEGAKWYDLAVYYRYHTRVLNHTWYGLDRTKVRGGNLLLCLYSRDSQYLVEAPLSVLE